ncbi:MAG TPA: sodium-translocating pyrophosphatase, partial [Fibrobacteres bacterium]|nr:sodium-translocating pyrophosphatase [Fibrobacterota bacterium]
MDGSIELPLLLGLLGGIGALAFAIWKSRWILAMTVPDEKLSRIGGYVAKGAMAFLMREYTVLLPFAIAASLLLLFGNHGVLKWEALTFLIGAACSALSGYFGMKVATQANMRTAWAARTSLNDALKVSFAGGSVMGMSVMGLALLGITCIMASTIHIFGHDYESMTNRALPILSGFALG